MLMTAVAFAAALLAQQPPEAPKPEVAVLKAGLGSCSADFIVKDAAGAAVYGAAIHVRVRYGAFGVKRSDLEVGTNSNGEARIEGLPDKARPLVYDVAKAGKKATAEQNVATTCAAKHTLTLK
ncbi:MAG: hypothetical protein EXQ48_05535 [Acidobacteria bacterium]|nr:hypothetical protein [Acidobacteriota bacterium]